jgi:uridylate kinase
MSLQYNRVLLKLSGEALAGAQGFGLDYSVVRELCESIRQCIDLGAQMGVVVGGGNFWRGRQSGGMERTRADHVGMLATVMNALALADALEALGVDTRVQTAIAMQSIAEPYIRNRAVRHIEKGRVVIFGCGTGNPFFSTDTAAALRAAEIGADVILMAKMVDGVYDSDPRRNPDAKRYPVVSFSEILNRGLAVIDSTAASMCRDNRTPVLIFSSSDPRNIVRAVCGENIGTILREEV